MSVIIVFYRGGSGDLEGFSFLVGIVWELGENLEFWMLNLFLRFFRVYYYEGRFFWGY